MHAIAACPVEPIKSMFGHLPKCFRNNNLMAIPCMILPYQKGKVPIYFKKNNGTVLTFYILSVGTMAHGSDVEPLSKISAGGN